VRSALAGVLQSLYACLARRCPVLGEGALGPLGEPSYRLYNCRRCAVQVRICRHCDHGNIYCAGECSRICRRESLRRAGARYQRTRRGASCHAARQRAWRAREQPIVTHQGCAGAGASGSVAAPATPKSEPCDAQRVAAPEASSPGPEPSGRCTFCRTPLPVWTRLRRWAWNA
jgi:hypothetical protein